MKKIILITLIATMLIGCKKEEKEDETFISPAPIPSPTEEMLSKLNVKPSNREDITYIGLGADSGTYKIVGGKMKNNAWVAKFDANGNEIFSYQLKTTVEGYHYSHINRYSVKVIDNNVIILLIWGTNNSDPMAPIIDAGSILCVIDFNSGKELHQFSSSKNSAYNEYAVRKTTFSYFIQSYRGDNISHYYSVSLDGKNFWERKVMESEKYNGINPTVDMFLDDENIFYYYIYDKKYKSFNLKDYTLNYEFDIPVNYDYTSIGGALFHKTHDKSVIDDYIVLNYGVYHLFDKKYNLVDECYYKIDKKTGNIIENKSYSDYSHLYGISIEGLYFDTPTEQKYPFVYNDLKLCHGERLKIKIKLIPEHANNQNLVWRSSNTNLATVNDGLFSITSNTNVRGYVTITATSEEGGYTANLGITINDVHLDAHGFSLVQSGTSCNVSFISSITTSPVNLTPITIGSVYITDKNNSLIQVVSDVQDSGFKVIAKSQPETINDLYGDNLLNYLSGWKFVYTYKLPWMSEFVTKEVPINARLWSSSI